MKMKSFALLAIPALLTAFCAYITPVFAEDEVDAMNNNNSSFQTLADSGMQNQDTMNTDNTNTNNSNNNSAPTNPDAGSPDTASSTGDDDY